MLTGKNKIEFEKWYYKNIGFIPKCGFYELPFEMQVGVYIAFFDSVGFNIGVDRDYDFVNECHTDKWDSGFLFEGNYQTVKGYFNSRPEAQKEAIKQADELRNKQLKG
ncbi:MAG: hypothetical protein HRT87_01285 [Legionellales bacterium]|nr:hypothetical protein [Legionellales bacterium]